MQNPMTNAIRCLALLMLICLPALAQDTDIIITRDAAPDPASLRLDFVAGGFHRPIYATHAGDDSGRLFVLEQSGKIWILRDGARSGLPSWMSRRLSRSRR